jgi:cystathionine beta-lyase
MYDFDRIIERRGTDSYKYDNMIPFFGRDDLIPLWVADMDFGTPDFIIDALRKRLEHPVLGYTMPPQDYYDTISNWVESIHSWKVHPNHIRFIPGIVKGIWMAMECFLKPDEKVIIQTPVYHPFRLVPTGMGHKVVYNPLIPVYEDGPGHVDYLNTLDADRRLIGYEMDFNLLEEQMADPSVRMFVLCNPQNPSGICWSHETLDTLAMLACKHNVLVVSDEIHAEMALFGNRHIPFASVSKEAAVCSITFMAPSKTFNIAGVVASYAIVPDTKLRARFFRFLETGEHDSPNIFSAIATMAAYKEGAQWRLDMLNYVEQNILFVDSWFKEHIPSIRCLKPQASFLMWLDCRLLGLSQPQLVKLFTHKAGLALNDGSIFGSTLSDGTQGPEGRGFMRLNVGCPRSVLETALGRLESAMKS